jgi:hypothetical protein
MDVNKKVITRIVIVFVVLSILCSMIGLGLTGVGFTASILGVICSITGLLALLARSKVTGKTMLLCGGILLLIGFSFCSLFPTKF